MSAKERYKKNRTRVFEIYGIDPEDRRYNTHHIIFKSDTKRSPFRGYDVDQLANLCPMLITEHRKLHAFITRMELQFKKRRKHASNRTSNHKRQR